MRWLLVWTALLCGSANAQMMQAIVAGKTPAASSYVGPGDVVSGATAFWGFRGYTNAFASTGTGAAVKISRASDSAAIDVVILPTGAWDVATAATFCAATTCVVDDFYDQTGNGNTMSRNSAGAALAFNCINTSLPCAVFASSDEMNTPTNLTIGATSTISAVMNRTSVSFAAILIQRGNCNCGARYTSSANTVQAFLTATSVTATATDNAWHGLQFMLSDSTNSVIAVDGVSGTPGNAGGGPMAATDRLVIGGSVPLTGKMVENGIWSGVTFSGGQLTSMHANQSAYWGTP